MDYNQSDKLAGAIEMAGLHVKEGLVELANSIDMFAKSLTEQLACRLEILAMKLQEDEEGGIVE